MVLPPVPPTDLPTARPQPDPQWTAHWDPHHGAGYWFNNVTGLATWSLDVDGQTLTPHFAPAYDVESTDSSLDFVDVLQSLDTIEVHGFMLACVQELRRRNQWLRIVMAVCQRMAATQVARAQPLRVGDLPPEIIADLVQLGDAQAGHSDDLDASSDESIDSEQRMYQSVGWFDWFDEAERQPGNPGST